MWRILSSIARGVRCVRASHNCCQEGVEEHKHRSQVRQQHSLTPWYYPSPTSYHNKDKTLKSVNGIHRRENQSIRTLENDIEGREEKHKQSGSDSRDMLTAGHSSSTPWHWEILLEPSQDKPLSKEEKQENGKHTHDRKGTCPLQQWGQFLSTYSILQAVGWGSAVALTWSLYHDWGVLRCKYKSQGQDYFFNSDTNIKSWFNELDTRVSRCPKNYSKQCQYIKDQAYYKAQQHKDMPDLQHLFTPETSRSPFCFFWNMAANQFELRKTMLSKATLKDKSLDTLFNNHIIQDFHTDPQLFQDKNTSQTLEKESYKNETEVSITKAQFSMQNTYSIQSNTNLFEDSECSQKPKLFIEPQASNLGEEDIEQSHTDKEGILLDKYKNEKDWDIGCSNGVQKSGRLEEESVSILSDPSTRTSSRREEVLLEDCMCDDSGQNVEVSASSQHLDKTDITELSDSFMEILKAQSQDIKMIQDQLLGMMEGERVFAVTRFKAGALLGDPSAVFNLALCYQLGHGVTQDLKMARELYEAASEAGHAWATYNLAVLLSRGQGGPSDSDRTYSLLIKAGKMGVPEAQEALRKLENPKNYFWKEDTLKSSRSEQAFASVSSSRWSSSYSTSDLEFMDESDVFISSNLSTDLNRSENTNLFYIG